MRTYILQAPIVLTQTDPSTGVSTIPAIVVSEQTIKNMVNAYNANTPLDSIFKNSYDTNGNTLYYDVQQIVNESGFLPNSYLTAIGSGSLSSDNPSTQTVQAYTVEYYLMSTAQQLYQQDIASPNAAVGAPQNWLPIGLVIAIAIIFFLLSK